MSDMDSTYIDLGSMSWLCMVCGDERPDRFISVHTETGGSRFVVTVNVRYCNDRGACQSGAPAKAAEMLGRMT